MAKPGSGKRKMDAVRKKRNNAAMKELKSWGKAIGIGKKKKKRSLIGTFFKMMK